MLYPNRPCLEVKLALTLLSLQAMVTRVEPRRNHASLGRYCGDGLLTDSPFPKSWWVVHGRLLAGCYPGSPEPTEASQKLGALLDAGVRTIVCLQEKDEKGSDGRPFAPYEPTLARLADERGADAQCLRFPVRDYSTPSVETMGSILDAIDDSLERHRPVYVHCWGGHGRTATVIGCWLVRHGMPADEALRHIAELRSVHPELRDEPAPQADVQYKMVRNWNPGE
jgi:hypothetical protein